MTDRYDSIGQALTICRALSKERLTRAELAARLDVHERTIRRLIDALRAAGVDVRQTRRGGLSGPMEYSVPKHWHRLQDSCVGSRSGRSRASVRRMPDR